MATIVLGAVGAGVGAVFGDAQLGLSLGVMLAGVLFPEKMGAQERGKLDDLRATGSSYGVMIPQVWGAYRLGGNILWSTKLQENKRETSQGGKGGGGGSVTTYYYTTSLAIGWCRGPATEVKRIWAEDVLIYDATAATPTKLSLTNYLGSETQTVDPTIEAVEGAGQWTAYRGTCYTVIANFNLEQWGNRIPSMTAEVLVGGTYDALIEARGDAQAYYRFESSPGVLSDSSGNTRALTHASEQTVAGKYGSGIDTNGASLHATVGDVAGMRPSSAGQAITVTGYVRHSGGSATAIDEFRYKSPVDNSYGWDIYIDWLSQQLTVKSNGTAGTFSHNVVSFPRTTTWTHFAWTYKVGGRSKFYVNGALVDDQAASASSLAFTADPSNILEITGGGITQAYWDELSVHSSEFSAGDVAAVSSAAGVTVGAIAADVYGQVGLSSGQYDVSRATDLVDGFAVAQRQSGANALETLLRFYGADQAEADYQLVLVRRGDTTLLTLPAADLGAKTNEQPKPAIEVVRTQELELPVRVDVTYFAAARLYAQSTQMALRYTRTQLQDPLTVNTPLAIADDAARQGADRLLWWQWLERTQYRVNLGPKYGKIACGTCVLLPVNGANVRARVVSIDVGQFGELQCLLVPDDAAIMTQASTGGAAAVTAPTVDAVVATTFKPWSTPQVRDEDGFQPGFYVAATGAAGWVGGTIYYSPDGGTTWVVGGVVNNRATFGTTTSALGNGTSTTAVDNTHTVDVTLSVTGSLASTSQADVDAGDNAALVGGELIGFATATALGGLNYRLSVLMRGRRATTMTGHGTTESFVLLDRNCARVNVPTTLVGHSVPVKVLSPGQALGDVTAQNVTIATPVPAVQATDIQATAAGQQLVSLDGTTFAALSPVIADDLTGQLLDESGNLIYSDG